MKIGNVDRDIIDTVAIELLTLDGTRQAADSSIEWLTIIRDEEAVKGHDENVAFLDKAIAKLVVHAVEVSVS